MSADEFDLVRSRQRELRVPEAFEWVHEMNPGLWTVAAAAGLAVRESPLMLHCTRSTPRVPGGYAVRLLDADDGALPAVWPRSGSVSVIPAPRSAMRDRRTGTPAVDRHELRHDATRREIGEGLLVVANAEADGYGPIAGGSQCPRGAVTEITGVATLPAYRRRGVAAAVTDALCAWC